MRHEAARLPVLTFDGNDVPAEQNFDAFHQGNAPLYDTGLVGDPGRFTCAVTDYLVDDLIVSRLQLGPLRLNRTDRHLTDGTTDWVAIQVHHRGHLRGRAGRDGTIDLGTHRIGVLDFSKSFTARAGATDSTWVAIPRTRIAASAITGASGSIDVSTARGRVLAASIGALWRRLPTAHADDAADLAAGIVETTESMLSPDDFAPSDDGLAAAMQEFIDDNLSDLDLHADALPALFHCSRATAYRLFEPHGGIAAYIRDQRLLHCVDELGRPTPFRRRISDVAVRWGFENPSHFNRIFKAKFGLPPSQFSERARTAIAEQSRREAEEPVAEFHEWIHAT